MTTPTFSTTHTNPSPAWMGAPGSKRDRDDFAGAPRMTKASRSIPRPMLRAADASSLGCTVHLLPKHQMSTNAKELISCSDHQSTLGVSSATPVKYWVAQCRMARKYRDQNDLHSFELELVDLHDRWDPLHAYNEAKTLPNRRAVSQRAEDAQYWLNHCWTRLLAVDREQAEWENKRSLEEALVVAAQRSAAQEDALEPARHRLSEAQEAERLAASDPPLSVWSDCGHWQTGKFNGKPELSNQTFDHVYTHAPT